MTYGIVLDTSNNDDITGPELKASGAVALIAKGTEGTGYKDPTYQSQVAAAQFAGIPHASYLFLHPASPGSEAQEFLDYVKPAAGHAVFIDCEVTDGSPMGTVANRAQACADALTAAGMRPTLYSSYSFLKQLYALRPSLKGLPAWEAGYPSVIYRWFPALLSLRAKLRNGVSVDLWQFTPTYVVGSRKFDASILLVPVANVFGVAPPV